MRRIEAVTRPGRGASCSARAPTRCASSPRCCACPRREVVRAVARLERAAQGAREAPSRRRGPTAAPRTPWRVRRGDRPACAVVVEPVDAPDAEGPAGAVRPRCGRGSATPRWSSGAAVDGRVHLVANFAPAACGARGEGRATSCAWLPRWSAAAEAAATRWRRPAAATRRSCRTRRWPPRASGDRERARR